MKSCFKVFIQWLCVNLEPMMLSKLRFFMKEWMRKCDRMYCFTKVDCLLFCDRMFDVSRYIAPEQVQDKDVTPATDIYALGLVIWTIANREYAFDGISKQEVWTLVVEGKRPTIATNLPKALIDIIEACWEQNPEDRPNITFVRMELEKLEKTVENPNSSAMNRMQVTL